MALEKEISIQTDIMVPKEIDLGSKAKGKKRRQKVDEYDYDDPFIEPFEGEAQAVMIECNLEDFFVYSGQLPYSAKKVLSVYKAKKAKQEDKAKKQGNGEMSKQDDSASGRIQDNVVPDEDNAPDRSKSTRRRKKAKEPTPASEDADQGQTDSTILLESNSKVYEEQNGRPASKGSVKRYGGIPKSDLKNCEYLASLIRLEFERKKNVVLETEKVEAYAYYLILKQFQKERQVVLSPSIETFNGWKPSNAEIEECVEVNEARMGKVFDRIAEDIHNHRLYAENFSLFKGFNKEEFLFDLSEYFLLFMKTSFLNNSGSSFNKTRKEAHANVSNLFSSVCRNSSQIQHYLMKHISQTRGVKNALEAEKNDATGDMQNESDIAGNPGRDDKGDGPIAKDGVEPSGSFEEEEYRDYNELDKRKKMLEDDVSSNLEKLEDTI